MAAVENKHVNVVEISLDPKKHPWRRLIAFFLDSSLYTAIFFFIISGIFKVYVDSDTTFYKLVQGIISAACYLALDFLLVSKFGTSFGRWIFGFKITNEDGSYLTLSQAFVRSFNLIRYGHGFGIIIYALVRNWISWRDSFKEGDELWNTGYKHTLKDLKGSRIAIAILAFCLIVAVDVNTMLMLKDIVYRGDLTMEQYARNVNVTYTNNKMQHMEMFDRTNWHMRGDGEWEKLEGNIYYSDGNTTIRNLVVEDGYVKGVEFEKSYSNKDMVYTDRLDARNEAEVLAIIKSSKGTNYLNILNREFKTNYNDYLKMENGEWSFGDYIVSKKVEKKGFYLLSDGFYGRADNVKDKDAYFRVKVTVKKVVGN